MRSQEQIARLDELAKRPPSIFDKLSERVSQITLPKPTLPWRRNNETEPSGSETTADAPQAEQSTNAEPEPIFDEPEQPRTLLPRVPFLNR